MDRMQKQSILIVLSSLEQQISALRNLVMIGGNDEVAEKVQRTEVAKRQALGYTSDEEDKAIADSLAPTSEDIREAFLNELVDQTKRGLDG